METLLLSFSRLARAQGRAIVISLSSLLCAGFQLQAQSLDFGDAPDSYGTLLSSNGPRHVGFTRVYLGGAIGSSIDTEPDGQPGTMADGDDSHDQQGTVLVYGGSDEDCLANGFPTVCLLRSAYSLRVTVYNNSGADATVSAWIDVNKNGVFDANERTQAVVPTTPNLIHYNGTPVTLVWNNMSGLTEGWTYARVRVASNASEVATPTGLANSGEVEDYRVQLKDEYDFGDAPESYGTLLKDNGPRHLLNGYLNFSTISLSSIAPCADDDGKPSLLADADDTRQDEDDIRLPALTVTAKSYSAVVSVFNLSGSKAIVSGWIDFNRNGLFDAGERTQVAILPDMRGYVTLNWRGLSGLAPGRTYARFRIASDAREVASPTGYANSGEVQDYSLMIGQDASPVENKVNSARRATDNGLSLVVYPNPVVEQLTVRLSTSQPVGIRVYSVNGTQVLAQEGAIESVDVRSLPAGLYVIEVSTLSGPALRQRFVKQ